MSKFYVLYSSYDANSAPASRLLGYLRGLEENQIDTNVYFFWPDKNMNMIDNHYRYIHITYLWEKYYLRGRASKYLSYLMYFIFLWLKFKKNDKVYLYGLTDLLPLFIKKKGVLYYHERTEVPLDYGLGSRLHQTSLKEYLTCCRRLEGLIVISTYLRDYFIQNGVDPNRIIIINITVDPDRFGGLSKNKEVEKYIAYCGTVENAVDGVDVLIKSFAKIVGYYPDLKLYLVGAIPYAKDRSKNQKLIYDLGIEDKVVFTGKMSSKQVPQMLMNAQVVALARPNSVFAEAGFPTKLGEYLMSGTPTVITKVGDIPLFLKHKESACLANADDVDDFANNIKWILDNTESAQIMAENGRTVAMNNFSYLGETNKLINLMSIKN